MLVFWGLILKAGVENNGESFLEFQSSFINCAMKEKKVVMMKNNFQAVTLKTYKSMIKLFASILP